MSNDNRKGALNQRAFAFADFLLPVYCERWSRYDLRALDQRRLTVTLVTTHRSLRLLVRLALDIGLGHVAADVVAKLLGRGLEKVGADRGNQVVPRWQNCDKI